jgi:hypothetical protein
MTPDQYLAQLERFSQNGEFQAVLKLSRAHLTLELSPAQSILAGTILSHALVHLHWEATPLDRPSARPMAAPDWTGRADPAQEGDGGPTPIQTPAQRGENGPI